MKPLKLLVAVMSLIFLGLAVAPTAQAIVIVPALILIPVAKVIAIVMGGLAFPALSLGVLWSKLFNTSFKKIIMWIGLVLFLTALALAVYLKVSNPARPMI